MIKDKKFKENIEVCVRIRPKLNHEKDKKINLNLGKNSIELFTKNNYQKEYLFSNIYDEYSNNYWIYENSIKKIAMGCLDGINGSIFLYGHTGAGKTHTMIGYDKVGQIESKKKIKKLYTSNTTLLSSPLKPNKTLKNFNFNKEKSIKKSEIPDIKSVGILQISIKDILEKIQNDNNFEYEINFNYYEIYNDNIYDLLDSSYLDISQTKINKSIKPLKIKENTKTQEFYVSGLIKQNFNTYEEFLKFFENGEKNRHIGSTNFNHQSSRSHTIFKLNIKKTNVNTKDISKSSLDYIDLAGSEKICEFNGETTNEGKHINKSLFFLTQIISLKSSNVKLAHIPYRNSPLTKLLKNSIGGNARTTIILCVSPLISSLENNIYTLNFGLIAKKVKNEIKINLDIEKTSIDNISYSKIDDKNAKKLNELINQNKTLKKNYQLFFGKNVIKENKIKNRKKSLLLISCGIIKSNIKIKKKLKKNLVKEINIKLKNNQKNLNNDINKNKNKFSKEIEELEKELNEQKISSNMLLKGKLPKHLNDKDIKSFELNCLILLENIKINKAKKMFLDKKPEFEKYLNTNMPLKEIPKIDENNIDYIQDHTLLGINDENIDNGDLIIK